MARRTASPSSISKEDWEHRIRFIVDFYELRSSFTQGSSKIRPLWKLRDTLIAEFDGFLERRSSRATILLFGQSKSQTVHTYYVRLPDTNQATFIRQSPLVVAPNSNGAQFLFDDTAPARQNEKR